MTQQGCPVGAVTDGKLNLTHTLPDNELWDENSSFWTVTKDGQPFDFLPYRKVDTRDPRLSQDPVTLEKTETSIKVRVDANTAISARIRYWPKYNDSFVTETNPQISPLTVHVQQITGLADGTTYCYQVLTSDDGGATWYPVSIPAEFTTDDTITTPPVGNSMSFPDIAMAAPTWNGFYDDLDYVGAYLKVNQNVLDYEVQTISNVKHVVPISLPVLDTNTATALPAPSGGDDTSAVENIINNGGDNKVYYGTGIVKYRFNGLSITPNGITIHQMPSEPVNTSTGQIINVNGADDLMLIDCPQDGKNYSGFYQGIRAENCHRIRLHRSGLENMYHLNGSSGGGVFLRNCHNFKISGGIYKNLLNKENGTNTCRANALWLSGGSGITTDGGAFFNCQVENLQSTGNPADGDADAEVFTTQGHSSSGAPILIAGLTCIDAGKRLAKAQARGGIHVVSNFYNWLTDSTPELGNRTRLEAVTTQLSEDNVVFRNNHVKIDGNRNWSYCLSLVQRNGQSNNINYDNNDIEINCPHGGATHSRIIYHFRSNGSGTTLGTNITLRDNRVRGSGGVNLHRQFANISSNGLIDTGNTFSLSDTNSPYLGA